MGWIKTGNKSVILCMATCLVALSIALLTTVELLRRRSRLEELRTDKFEIFLKVIKITYGN